MTMNNQFNESDTSRLKLRVYIYTKYFKGKIYNL